MKKYIAFSLLFLFVISPVVLKADDPPKTKQRFWMRRLSFAPAVSLFSPNPDYTGDSRPRAAFCVSMKMEPMFKNKTHLLIGLEYLTQGAVLETYYFASGYSELFDKKFGFEHAMRFHELQLPLLIKHSLFKETNDLNTYYVVAGWSLRYFVWANTSIVQNSTANAVYEGTTTLTVENSSLLPRLGSVLQIGFGRQRNSISDGRALFAEINYKYAVSRFLYTGNGSSNQLFIRDSNITLNLGFRF